MQTFKQDQTLKVNYYLLDVESLTELFSSQTAIKNLAIKIRPLPRWVQNAYYEKIIDVIIRHQETLEVIDIRIETISSFNLEMLEVSIRKIKDIIACKGRLRFPRLKT